MREFDPTKPVQCRNGCEARIICTDKVDPEGYTIVALLKDKTKDELIYTYAKDGSFYGDAQKESDLDLINIPTKVTLKAFVNVSKSTEFYIYDDERSAWAGGGNQQALAYYRAVAVPVTIEFEE